MEPATNKRRSQRLFLQVRVVLEWKRPNKSTSTEETHTIVVSAHGALIALAMKVQLGEKLLVKNWNSGEEQESRVVRVGEERGNQNLVAIEFTKTLPHFWHIDFPPADWKLMQD